MLYGVDASLIREFDRGAVKIIPAPSSALPTCACLGWPVHDIPVILPAIGEPGVPGVARMIPAADALRPFLALCRNADSVEGVTTVLADRPDTKLTALTSLDGVEATGLSESVVASTVADPSVPAGNFIVLAVEPSESAHGWLRNDDFDSNGQLTKTPIR